MISWKPFFERLSEEYEMAKKKKQALDNLLNTGRISQSTYELFNKEIDEATAEIERQQKALLEKMDSKMGELEERVKTLEMLLANFEVQHVTGEVDEEVYQSEVGPLSMGLETARHELDTAREAVNQLSSGIQIPTTEVVVQQEMEPQPPESVEAPQTEVEIAEEPSESIEASQTEVEIAEEPVSDVEEKLPEPPAEPIEVSETDSFETPQENPQETLQSTEESQWTETETEGEENQEM